jgi:hypothetical protein
LICRTITKISFTEDTESFLARDMSSNSYIDPFLTRSDHLVINNLLQDIDAGNQVNGNADGGMYPLFGSLKQATNSQMQMQTTS